MEIFLREVLQAEAGIWPSCPRLYPPRMSARLGTPELVRDCTNKTNPKSSESRVSVGSGRRDDAGEMFYASQVGTEATQDAPTEGCRGDVEALLSGQEFVARLAQASDLRFCSARPQPLPKWHFVAGYEPVFKQSCSQKIHNDCLSGCVYAAALWCVGSPVACNRANPRCFAASVVSLSLPELCLFYKLECRLCRWAPT